MKQVAKYKYYYSSVIPGIIFFLGFTYLLNFVKIFTGEGLFTDEAYYYNLAWRIAQGEVMYRDFFAFYMPLPFYLTALIFKLGGPSFVYPRVLVILIISLSASAGFKIAWEKFRCGWVAILVPLTTISLLYPFWRIFTPRYFSLFFEIMTIYFISVYVFFNQKKRYLFLSGFLAGLTILTIQSDGLALFLSIPLLFLITEKKENLKKIFQTIFIFVISATLPILFFIVYFIASGTLYDFLYSTTFWIFKSLSYYLHTSYFETGFTYIKNYLHKLQASPFSFIVSVTAIITLALIGIVPLMVYPVSLFKLFKDYIKHRSLSEDNLKIAFFTFIGVSLFAVNLNRTDPFHMMLISFPWIFIVLLYVKYNKQNLLNIFVKSLTIFYLIVFLFLNISYIYSSQKYYIYPIEAPGGTLYTEKEDLAEELNHLKSFFREQVAQEEIVYGYAWGGAYLFFIERKNHFRHDVLLPYSNTEDQIAEGLDYLQTRNVNYVIFDSNYQQVYWTKHKNNPLLVKKLIDNDRIAKFIRENYIPLVELPHLRLRIMKKRVF